MRKVENSYVPITRESFERREVSWRTVIFGFIRSRRHAKRRESEIEPLFTDWHSPWIFFLAISIMVMSSIDAFLTLELLERGAYEANPVIAWVMEWGTASFAAIKMAVTGVCILILVFLARVVVFKRIRTGAILTVFFSIYATLICYEFVSLVNRL